MAGGRRGALFLQRDYVSPLARNEFPKDGKRCVEQRSCRLFVFGAGHDVHREVLAVGTDLIPRSPVPDSI